MPAFEFSNVNAQCLLVSVMVTTNGLRLRSIHDKFRIIL